MHYGHRYGLTLSFLIASAALAGCVVQPHSGGEIINIRMWVEQIDWEVHPGVSTTVWAFCAEGDRVEAVHTGPCGVPGPTIRATQGDTVRLTFENTHHIAHTVHLHGWHDWAQDMAGNRLMGDHMVVEPGETQTIEWIAEPAGSFIYHCHFETPTHMDMGMYGAFIVADPDERLAGRDFVMALDEWAIHDQATFLGSSPSYNHFTINGKSFPLTQPLVVDPNERVRIHMVNAGYQFHAMHIHGYTPDSWEGVAGPRHAVPTDVREIAPGQTVVVDFEASREGVWLMHDHVVHTVTAGADGGSFGVYPRGMLTVLVVGAEHLTAIQEILPNLITAARNDAADPRADHAGHDHGDPHTDGNTTNGNADVSTHTIDMKDFTYAPSPITVALGTTITWTNSDGVAHTVTDDADRFDSGDIVGGASWSRTFDAPGTYTYHCTPHAFQDDGKWEGMVATVIVEEPST